MRSLLFPAHLLLLCHLRTHAQQAYPLRCGGAWKTVPEVDTAVSSSSRGFGPLNLGRAVNRAEPSVAAGCQRLAGRSGRPEVRAHFGSPFSSKCCGLWMLSGDFAPPPSQPPTSTATTTTTFASIKHRNRLKLMQTCSGVVVGVWCSHKCVA